jgi:putative zinc finger/helix-turn-helix YgiT family protein
MNCPNGHGPMPLKKTVKKMLFRDVDISVAADVYVCPVCKLEAGTVQQTARVQLSIAEAYRTKAGLLTGRQIRVLRNKAHITQEELAAKTGAGIASIKRWEGAQIQTKSMDLILRRVLAEPKPENNVTGGREFCIPRVKLVLNALESCLGFRILKKNDKMLFATKYLWYADMVAYRDAGRSMTGSTYAALPYGPQLNNYKDLIDEIKGSNPDESEPLTVEEDAVIHKICKAFPTEKKVYDAAHKEVIWKRASTGSIIPYSHASELREM